jgi:hypothetical protein
VTKSKKTIAAVVLSSIALTMVGLTTIPFNGTARAAAENQGAAAELAASAEQAPRGDLLLPAGCLGQVWPDISAECLITEDGSAAGEVRTVTIGYQTGDNTTVLVRLPAPLVASN